MTGTNYRDGRLWFVAGVAFAMVFAGPLIGAVWGALTVTGGSGNTRSMSAYRLIETIAARRHTGSDFGLSFEDKGACRSAIALKMNQAEAGLRDVLQDTDGAIAAQRGRAIAGIGENARIVAVSRLSVPVLGGLEGCFNGSILSPLCERYVKNVAAAARPTADDLRAIADANRTRREVGAC